MTKFTAELKALGDTSIPTHSPLNCIGSIVLNRNGALMMLKASWSASLWSLFRIFGSAPRKGFSVTWYRVFSGKSIDIEGSGGFSGGAFNWFELRVRVGSGGRCGVRSMEKGK